MPLFTLANDERIRIETWANRYFPQPGGQNRRTGVAWAPQWILDDYHMGSPSGRVTVLEQACRTAQLLYDFTVLGLSGQRASEYRFSWENSDFRQWEELLDVIPHRERDSNAWQQLSGVIEMASTLADRLLGPDAHMAKVELVLDDAGEHFEVEL
jgi:hypothetical protein